MGKSRAEIQRAYRERLKKDPEKYQSYLEKARGRKQKNYVPAAELSRKERETRRLKNCEYLRQHRERRRLQENVLEVHETSGYESGVEPGALQIRMNFPGRGLGPRRRAKRELAKKKKELTILKTKFDQLQKKHNSTKRRLNRLVNKSRNIESSPASPLEVSSLSESTPSTSSTMSPRHKTSLLMKEAGLTKKQQSCVKKQLLLGNAIESQFKGIRRQMKPKETVIARNMIGAKILRRYRLLNKVSKGTGLGRNRLGKSEFTPSQGFNPMKLQRIRELKKSSRKVIEFLMRDDNSIANPGKNDKMRNEGKVEQTRTLNDYLKNLHQKYLSENPEEKLSLATFCRIRPRHLKTVSFISRNTCMCTKHQNVALCVEALRKNGASLSKNPEKLIEDQNSMEIIKAATPDVISVGQWSRQSVVEKGKTKMVMKIVAKDMAKTDFLQFMEETITEFSSHVTRVKTQYREVTALKNTLSHSEVMAQMDFAENYVCKTMEEVQSAYWTQTNVTLHPVVLYFKKPDDTTLHHKSLVIISDEMSHNAETVLAFVDEIMPTIKEVAPTVHTVHYWTDSPTSQYRNKTIFSFVANHRKVHGVRAFWNYFEAGHGKGPCDGLGGTTKRMADEAIKTSKAVIQDAFDFFKWTQSDCCTMSNVIFKFVSSLKCQDKSRQLNSAVTKPRPIKGTMKIHAVCEAGDNKLLTADVSCYCSDCKAGTGGHGHWTEHDMVEYTPTATGLNENRAQTPEPTTSEQRQKNKKKGAKKVTKTRLPTKPKKSATKSTDADDEAYCLVCAEPWSNSVPGEEWIQCSECKQWAHAACTDYRGKGAYFCHCCE